MVEKVRLELEALLEDLKAFKTDDFRACHTYARTRPYRFQKALAKFVERLAAVIAAMDDFSV